MWRWLSAAGAVVAGAFFVFQRLRAGGRAEQVRKKAQAIERDRGRSVHEAQVAHDDAEVALAKARKAQVRANARIDRLKREGHGTAADILDRWNARARERVRRAERRGSAQRARD